MMDDGSLRAAVFKGLREDLARRVAFAGTSPGKTAFPGLTFAASKVRLTREPACDPKNPIVRLSRKEAAHGSRLGPSGIRGVPSLPAAAVRSLSGLCPGVWNGSHACCLLVAGYRNRHRHSHRSFSAKPTNIHGRVVGPGSAHAFWPPTVGDIQCICASVVPLRGRHERARRASQKSSAESELRHDSARIRASPVVLSLT